MTHRLSVAHPVYAVRLRAIERELRRDPELLAAFTSAAWTTPRRHRLGKRWDVLLLVVALLGLGLALSPIGGGSGHPCVPTHPPAVTLAHAYDRPCS
jgi:hypothetical protein